MLAQYSYDNATFQLVLFMYYERDIPLLCYKNILFNFLLQVSNFCSCMDSTRIISKCGLCKKSIFFLSHRQSFLATFIDSCAFPTVYLCHGFGSFQWNVCQHHTAFSLQQPLKCIYRYDHEKPQNVVSIWVHMGFISKCAMCNKKNCFFLQSHFQLCLLGSQLSLTMYASLS